LSTLSKITYLSSNDIGNLRSAGFFNKGAIAAFEIHALPGIANRGDKRFFENSLEK
jgi:hypothetical protein